MISTVSTKKIENFTIFFPEVPYAKNLWDERVRFCDRENPSGVLRKGLAQLVHHVLFMLHEGMGVAAEGDGGVFVS